MYVQLMSVKYIICLFEMLLRMYKMVQLPKNYCEVSYFFLGNTICEKPSEVTSSILLFEDN